MLIWAYLRHYLNLRILKSLLPGGEFRTIGPYELNWDTQQYKCWISQAITFPLLAALQAVNIFWFILILRILYRVLATGEEKDERSDNEEDEEEDEVDDGKSYADAVKENGEATKPQVMLNGKPIAATGVETRAAARRS